MLINALDDKFAEPQEETVAHDVQKRYEELAAKLRGPLAWERSERLRLKAEITELKARPVNEVKERVLSQWDSIPSFEHGAYQVLSVEDVRRLRERNNVDRPSRYGATIQELTTTALFLYSLVGTVRERGADGKRVEPISISAPPDDLEALGEAVEQFRVALLYAEELPTLDPLAEQHYLQALALLDTAARGLKIAGLHQTPKRKDP